MHLDGLNNIEAVLHFIFKTKKQIKIRNFFMQIKHSVTCAELVSGSIYPCSTAQPLKQHCKLLDIMKLFSHHIEFVIARFDCASADPKCSKVGRNGIYSNTFLA